MLTNVFKVIVIFVYKIRIDCKLSMIQTMKIKPKMYFPLKIHRHQCCLRLTPFYDDDCYQEHISWAFGPYMLLLLLLQPSQYNDIKFLSQLRYKIMFV